MHVHFFIIVHFCKSITQFRVPGFGNTTTIETLDPAFSFLSGYMAPLVNRLVAAGLVRGVSVRGVRK